MFEAAELGRELDKNDYKAQLPDLRAQLLQTQFALSKTNIPVIIIVSGIDAAGRGEVVNALNEWLDPRGLETFSLDGLTDEERERPHYWRFWRRLPNRGRIGVYFGGWYVDPIEHAAHQTWDRAKVDEELDHVRRFETMLVEDGALIVKIWLHLSQKEQRKRLKTLEKDPHSRRSVTENDWKSADLHPQFVSAAERAIRHTDSGAAPWVLIEATDPRYRNITVARTVLNALRQRIDEYDTQKQLSSRNSESPLIVESSIASPMVAEPRSSSSKAHLTVLDKVDITQQLTAKEYRQHIQTLQGKLHRLTWAAHQKKRSSVFVFEGWDAAGKGGCIRRMTQAMDARLYQVISTAAPTDEERAHHYLWRFWRHIPRAGLVTVYDRSWYGRVLVERVENFAKENEWKRAYLEINGFEEQLINHGTIVLKFWIHISPEEQLRRFKEREVIAYKQHKITDEDWRNRDKWDAYTLAVNDMVARTSTALAPWVLVSGEDKGFGRIEVLKTVCNRLEEALSS